MTDVALVVEGSYPYVTGGVSTWAQQLIGGLPDVSFSVVNLGEAEEPRYSRPANLVEVLDVPLDPDTQELAGELPEATIYHALATGAAGDVARRAAAARGRRFLLSEHGLAWLEARIGIVGCKGPKGKVDPLLVEAQARRAYGEAFAVTSVCAWNARRQESLGARGVRVLQNAAPAASFGLERDRRAPLVGFVGRVVAVKDVLVFLDACGLVADRIPGARFVVVGPLDQDVEYAERCLARAESLALEIEFTGSADAAAWYPRLDALVLTSRSEAQPLVVLEAMAAGVPVVATTVGGCPELLHGRGLLTRPGDSAGTARAVLRLLGDDDLRSAMVDSARAHVARRHDAAALLGAYAALYEEAVA